MFLADLDSGAQWNTGFPPTIDQRGSLLGFSLAQGDFDGDGVMGKLIVGTAVGSSQNIYVYVFDLSNLFSRDPALDFQPKRPRKEESVNICQSY